MIQLDNIYICLFYFFCIELFFSSVIIAMALAFILIHIISIIIRKKTSYQSMMKIRTLQNQWL